MGHCLGALRLLGSILIKGGEETIARLGKLNASIALEVRKVINVSALAVQKTAQNSIKVQSLAIQLAHKFGSKKHRASLPYTPPNSDTDNLVKHITVSHSVGVITSGYTASVTSGAAYSRYLEEGTKKMKPRPFMKPALKKHAKKIDQNIKQAISGEVIKW